MTKWLFVLGISFYSSSLVLAQEKTFTIELQNLSIQAALEKLSNASEYLFSYNPNHFSKKNNINKSYNNQSLNSILQDLLEPQRLEYAIMQNMVIITKQKETIAKNTLPKQKVTIPNTPAPPELIIRDSVILVYDTIVTKKIVYDTIYQTLMEKYYDTTTIVNTVSKYGSKTGNFSLALNAGLTFPVFQQKQDEEANDSYLLSNTPESTIGLRVLFETKHWGVGSGITFNTHRCQHTQTTETFQTFYEVDTIGSYYIIVDNEPQYFYIVDSTENQILISNSEEKLIPLLHLSIPLRFTYRIDFSPKWCLWAGTEAAVSFLVNAPQTTELPNIRTTHYFNYGFLTQIGYRMAYNSLCFIEGKYKVKSSGFLQKSTYKAAFLETSLGFRFFF